MKKYNRGSATVEACFVIPLFLFFMLAVVYMFMMLMADAHIHQSLAEAAIYGAQYCYLEERMLDVKNEETKVENEAGRILINNGIINYRFHEYLGEDKMIDRVVAGGTNGIIIIVTPDDNNPKIFHATAYYAVNIAIPMLGSFRIERTDEIKQKAFLGYTAEDSQNESEIYVYITPNESVYHLSRSCSHLTRKVHTYTGHGNYPPCSFCGKNDNASGKVYIAEFGDAYHNNPKCLGLKRTVIRVKRNSVAGINCCSLCGK